MRPAPMATNSAPTMPSPMPTVTNSPRRSTPRVAAQTIEMISAASSTSRKTSSATPGIRSLHNQPAFGRVLVEVTKKTVVAGVQGTYVDRDAAVSRHDLLAIEIRTLEFFWRGIFVVHGNLELGPSRHLKLARLIYVIFEYQLVLRQVVGKGHARQGQHNGGRND